MLTCLDKIDICLAMFNRFAVLVACLALTAAAVPATAPARPAAGPRLTAPASAMRHALTCNGALKGARRTPVLLVHGTFADSKINWSWNYKKTLPARGRPACTVDLPDRSAGDIQASSEYVVYAIRAMARRSERKIAVIALSQGGLNTRWALRWWPDLRHLVSDVVLLAAPNHGALFTNKVCTGPGLCAESLYQMRSDSMFLRALNRRETVPGVSFTAVSTADDSVFVTPDEARLRGASNIVVQRLCPGHRIDHVGLAYDGPAYAIAMDALDHRGPARLRRLDRRAACRRDTMPGVTRALAEAKVQSYQATLGMLLGPSGPKAEGEVPLARYASR
jgi:triacylglycerol lipase